MHDLSSREYRGKNYLACKHTQNSLVNVHDWIIGTFVVVNYGIGMQTNNQIVTKLFGLLEEIQMSDVEQIECTSNIYLQ